MNAKVNRRTTRIRNEMRLWLRTNYGHRFSYAKEQIDEGREDLGFRSADDAYIAYSLFGADLSPSVLGGLELTVSIEDLDKTLAIVAEEPGLACALLSDS